jgi:hypothetical protein
VGASANIAIAISFSRMIFPVSLGHLRSKGGCVTD